MNKLLSKYAFIIIILLIVNSCKEDEPIPQDNDTDAFLNDIAAVWTLESGVSTHSFSFNEEFKWLDNDCEDVVGKENYQETDNESKTYIYTNSMVNYDRKYATTRTFIAPYEGSEYEDAQNIIRSVNYNYEISIEKNGEYKVYVNYSLFEENFPLSLDSEGEMQFGKTFAGTYEYTDKWSWQDNYIDKKSTIEFAGFPLIQFGIKAVYQLPDLSFDYNYINSITFNNQSIIFDIDKLNNQELTLTFIYNNRIFYQEVENSWEAFDPQGNNYNCEGTYRFTTVEDYSHMFEFIK